MDETTAPTGTTVFEAADKFKALLAAEPVEETEESTEQEITEEVENPVVKTYKVKVEGEELEVPEDELLKGYSRTADYTRKTQKLADERKAMEAEFTAVKTERQRYAEGLKLLESQFSQQENVDWNRLREEDPIGYATKKLEARDRQDQLAAIQQERQRIAHLEAEEHSKALQQHIQSEQAKLADAIPEWRDAKVAKAEKEKLTGYLLNQGYSEADISQIYDSRAVQMIRKAVLYDEMMSQAKNKTEKVSSSPKIALPGNLKPADSRQYTDAKNQFKRTGSVRDAAELAKLLLRK